LAQLVERVDDLDESADPALEVLDADAFVGPVDAALFTGVVPAGDEAVGNQAQLAKPVGVGEPCDDVGHHDGVWVPLACDLLDCPEQVGIGG